MQLPRSTSGTSTRRKTIEPGDKADARAEMIKVGVVNLTDLEWQVLLALKRNGAYMPVRDKGPLFIVYPYDSSPELKHQKYYSRSAWPVCTSHPSSARRRCNCCPTVTWRSVATARA